MIARHLLLALAPALAVTALVGAQAQPAPAPLKTLPSGHVVADATVNGRGPYRFVVDTAAATSAILPSVRTALDLKPVGVSSLHGASGQQAIERFRLASLATAGVETKDLNVAGLPPGPVSRLGIDGIIGADILASHVVLFDQPGGTWRLLPPAASAEGEWVELPFELNSMRLPLLQVDVDGRPVTAIIDTGAPYTIVNWTAARQLGVAENDAALVKANPVRGATAQQAQRVQRTFDRLRIGAVQLDRPTFSISDLPVFGAIGLADKPAMILGMDQFAGRRFVVDYPRRRLLLSPTATPRPIGA